MDKKEKNKVKEIRTEVLSSSLRIEDTLVYSLARLYSSPNSKRLYIDNLEDDIFVDLTFDKKIKIFKKSFKYIEINIELTKEVNRQLYRIKEIRNNVIHREHRYYYFLEALNTSQGNDSVNVNFEKKGKKNFSFSIEELKEYKILCKNVEQNIYSILNEILDQRESDF